MDSLIAASARALAAGDALGALKRVALRDDPPALALRGIAMAQLGDYPRSRELLKRAARVPALLAEVARAREAFDRPAARRIDAAGEQGLRLADVARLLDSGALVVDACRRGIGADAAWCSLARRPVLFALARALAQAW